MKALNNLLDATSDDLAGIYKEVAETVGIDNAYEIFLKFKGLQLVFPQNFYSREYMATLIITEYEDGKSVRELARKYDYSESRIRQIVKGFAKYPLA